jgi:hypothetical protein
MVAPSSLPHCSCLRTRSGRAADFDHRNTGPDSGRERTSAEVAERAFNSTPRADQETMTMRCSGPCATIWPMLGQGVSTRRGGQQISPEHMHVIVVQSGCAAMRRLP